MPSVHVTVSTMRVRLCGVLAIASALGCVGDDSVAKEAGVDASDATTSDAVASDASVTCADAGPTVFPPKLGFGPFCPGGSDAGNHCPFGASCCEEQGFANDCATTCAAGYTQMECQSSAECPQDAGAMVCCAHGTVDTTSCAYPMIKNFTGTRCRTACAADEFTACATTSECPGLSCVGATTDLLTLTLAVCH